MVNPGAPCPPPLTEEALEIVEIPGELSLILASSFQMVCEDGAALTSGKRSGRGFHYFMDRLALGVDHIPCLEKVTLVGVDPYGMVHFLNSLFSVPVKLFSTSRRIFACQGDLPS